MQFWIPHLKKDITELEGRATKIVNSLSWRPLSDWIELGFELHQVKKKIQSHVYKMPQQYSRG